MSFLIFHPSVAPHVQQAALALYEADQLHTFHTGIVHSPDGLTQKILTGLARAAGIQAEKEFSKRTIHAIPYEKIRTHPWAELVRLVISRIDHDQRLSDLVWEQTEGHFDRAVAKSLTSDIRAVYGFEYSSRRTFQKAKKLGLKIAYEMPAPEPVFVHELLQNERERFPELETPYTRHVARREQKWIDHRRAEWECSNIVIAASRFTRDSYEKAGWPVANVRVVPLGAPEPVSEETALQGGSRGKGRLRFIWAGTFSVRKGAHYVLEAWRKNNLGEKAQLDIFGSLALPARLMTDLPEGIRIHGAVPRGQLWREFESHDALLFPTLCDGFGMVITEAWSRGLPVLTTNRAGASERLVHARNGLLFTPASAVAIAEIILQCSGNREELHSMRIHCRNEAAKWTWTHYRAALAETLNPLFS